jgi:hypothetical protein
LAKDLRDLNKGVLCCGAEGEWQLASFVALANTEHVVGGLSQIVVGVNFWKRDSMGEPVNSEDLPALCSGWNVVFVAVVVVKGWTHVPAIDTMGSHVGSLPWSDVEGHQKCGQLVPLLK